MQRSQTPRRVKRRRVIKVMIKKIVTVALIILVWENRHTITEHVSKLWHEGVSISQNN